MSKPVKGRRDVAKVAAISANGDAAIGELVAEAVDKVGLDGIIHVEQGTALETKLEVAEGTEILRGYASGYFVTNPERVVAELEDAYLLFYPHKIGGVAELLPILEKVAKTGRSLLVVAEVLGEALSMLVVNKLRGAHEGLRHPAPVLRRVARDGPRRSGGPDGRDGPRPRAGDQAVDASLDDLGRAKKIVVDQEKTTIVGGAQNPGDLEARVRAIDALYADTNSEFRHLQLKERLRRLVGGAALIRVGGTTAPETHERTLRIEDALYATKAAVAEGIVAGGGLALLRAADAAKAPSDGLPEDERAGIALARPRLRGPLPPDRRERRQEPLADPGARAGVQRRARLQRRHRHVREPGRGRRRRSDDGRPPRPPERRLDCRPPAVERGADRRRPPRSGRLSQRAGHRRRRAQRRALHLPDATAARWAGSPSCGAAARQAHIRIKLK